MLINAIICLTLFEIYFYVQIFWKLKKRNQQKPIINSDELFDLQEASV